MRGAWPVMPSNNPYIPFSSKVLKVIKHTEKEYTFRMAFGGEVRPVQFFEVSVPKYGEAPISVSGIVPGESVDLTIRRVGVVTNEVFEAYEGQSLLLRGPYGNGFEVERYVDGAPEGYQGNVGLVTKFIPDLPLRDPSTAQAIVVGPPPMMRFSVKGLLELGLAEENIWVSQERKMCCGLGKCGHCRIGEKYVCLDGPVFNYTQSKQLLD